MSEYIVYGSRDAIPPPFYSSGGHFLGLVLPGDQQLIDELVERVFEGPAEGAARYEALGKWVVLLVGTFDKLGSSAKNYIGQGTVTETQLSLWLPVRSISPAGEEHFCLTSPYVFVDNPMSVISGLEVFGYPKTFARFKPERWNGSAIEVWSFGGNFGITSHAEWTKLITVESIPLIAPFSVVGPAAIAPVEMDPMEVALALADRAGYDLGEATADEGGQPVAGIAGPGPVTVLKEVIEMLKGNAKQLFLKQFRACDGTEEACYRQVIEAPAEVKNIKAGLSLDKWKVTFAALGSQPIVAELGLANEQTTMAFELSMDIVLNPV